ncbi:NAC domain [Arabidopsis thaliana x Arabidopsis arenosa]|uniref:NAC domain n=1 Tax=Arabidopsis thaliana x Arabidopsis arenosa TaxID=1240361 RepID=A0A8T2BD60_9BRAS|nr:NAC domain [Arabidopsis thaliana x Arabidopsis arenosa]
MMKSRRDQSIEDAIVANYLKMMIDNVIVWPRHFLRSQDVYCKNPWTLFVTGDPMVLQAGGYFFVNRSVNSGKTDGCEHGCWRIVGRDKVIKSVTTGKILGLKKVYKFCKTEEPRSFIKFVEKEKRRARDKRIWVMEEYRFASAWKQDYVICKIRLLDPLPFEYMLSHHIRGYYKW